MNTIKKLIVTLIGVLMISLGFGQAAYATDLTKSENATDNTTDIHFSEEAIDNDREILDALAYETYVDEQGQVYYIEKEAKEAEIVKTEEEQKESEEKEEEKKKEKAKKKETKKKKPAYSKKELRLLSALVYSEAGDQSYEGMLAVANVVLNRAKSKAYAHANTIEEVIYDRKWSVQFSVTVKNKKTGKSILDRALELYDTGKYPGRNSASEKKAMNRAIRAAKAALEGENNIGDFLCFRMKKGASSIKKKYDYKIIGDHIFYRTK